MRTINLKDAVEESLRLLKEGGASNKTYEAYQTTGFGVILRHFTALALTNVDSAMLDAFVVQQRELYERGEFSTWKWRLVRRGCELLKCFAKTGKVDLAELRPWDPISGKPRQSIELDQPTPEQLDDPDDLFALIWRARQALLQAGLTELTVHHYTSEGMSVIFRKHTEQGLTCYCESLTRDMVAEKREKYERGTTSRVSYQNLRKAYFLLSEMHRTGRITFDKIPNWGLREPTPLFSTLLCGFCDSMHQTGVLASGTVLTAKSAIRGFLFVLEAQGTKPFTEITMAEVNTAIVEMAKRYKGGLKSAVYSVRIFLRYLYENKFTEADLSRAVPEMIAHRTTFREGFTNEESAKLLDEPDCQTPIGKRDFAMMLLAAQTGLRACDVVNLKRSNIDWRANEIRIVQRKTGKPLSLPLEPESGNAIADYLLHARPESNLPNVFICHTGFLRPVHNRSASALVTKYLRRSGIVSSISRRGFHSFRRSFGTRLMEGETPIDLLIQILGQSGIDSAKPYLSVDELGLKACALNLIRGKKAGGLA